MFVYTAKGGFRASAARKGSKQAQTRPLTLTGVNVVRYTLTEQEFASWLAESDAEKRTAILAGIGRRTESTTGRVQVTTESLAAFRAALLETVNGDPTAARVAALAMFASGIVAIPEGDADNTEQVVDDLFPVEAPAPEKASK